MKRKLLVSKIYLITLWAFKNLGFKLGRHVNNDDLFEVENTLKDKLSPLISILCGELEGYFV